MIQKIDKPKLTTYNLDPECSINRLTPNNDYSVPYIWGATAIGVNSDANDPKPLPVGPTLCSNIKQPAFNRHAREVFQDGAAQVRLFR